MNKKILFIILGIVVLIFIAVLITRQPVKELVLEEPIVSEKKDESIIKEGEVFEIRQYAEKLCEKVEGKGVPESRPLPRMTIETIISGSFSSAGAKEFFIACHDPTKPPNLIEPRYGDRYFYIIDSTGNIFSEMESGYGRFNSLPFQIIDINNDGVLEIMWGYGFAGGGGTYEHTYTYIYSLKHEELFEMKHQVEWEWASIVEEGKDDKLLVRDEIIFSENIEDPEFQPFKDYLSSDSYSEWYRDHGEYKWYEIDGEIFYLEERG